MTFTCISAPSRPKELNPASRSLGDLGRPTEGRNNSGADLRKGDVPGSVQGAVAVEDGPQEIPAALSG